MAVNVARIIDRADAQLLRLEAEHLARLRQVTNSAYARLAAEIRRRWADTLVESEGMTRTFAEARARVLLAQLEPYMRALEYGNASSGVPSIMRDVIQLGHQAGLETATELLTAFPASRQGLVTATARIDFRAVEAAVANSQARLARYGEAAIGKIEQAVVDGIVSGRGSQKVARDVREAIRGDAHVPDGGLHARAEMIARTELGTAKTDASKQRYAEAGVDLVQWYATLDERTCIYCAARHGNAYRIGDAVVPAHPNCRCYLAPFRPEWVELGLVDVEFWEESRREIEKIVPNLSRGPTPFEKAADRKRAPEPVWSPPRAA